MTEQRSKEEVIFIAALDDLDAIARELQTMPPEQQIKAMQERLKEEAEIYEHMRLKSPEGSDSARAFAALRQTLSYVAEMAPEAYRDTKDMVIVVQSGLQVALEEDKQIQERVEERFRAGEMFTPPKVLDPAGLETFTPLKGHGWEVN